jgi:hypothetical protein
MITERFGMQVAEEQGPFITPDEFEQRFEEWKLKRGL